MRIKHGKPRNIAAQKIRSQRTSFRVKELLFSNDEKMKLMLRVRFSLT